MLSSTQLKALLAIVGATTFVNVWAQGAGLDSAQKILLAILGESTVIGLILHVANRHLWHLPLVGRLIGDRIDIRGTWRGTLVSDFIPIGSEDPVAPKTVYLVIDQTFGSLHTTLLTDESTSATSTARIKRDADGRWFLDTVFVNTPQNHLRKVSQATRGGFSALVEGEHGVACSITGEYWTDRKTTGRVSFDAVADTKFETYARASTGDYVAYQPHKVWWHFWKRRAATVRVS